VGTESELNRENDSKPVSSIDLARDCVWTGFPFPLEEAYFVQEGHAGTRLCAGAGEVLVFHVTTNNLWLLSGFGNRLHIARIVEFAAADENVRQAIGELRLAAVQAVGEPQLEQPKAKTVLSIEPFGLQERTDAPEGLLWARLAH
jgi:hypothetical protein